MSRLRNLRNLGVVLLATMLLSAIVTPVAASGEVESPESTRATPDLALERSGLSESAREVGSPESTRATADLALERLGLSESSENPNVHLPKSAAGGLVFISSQGAPPWALSLPTGLDKAPALVDKNSALFRSSDQTFNVIAKEVNNKSPVLFHTSDQTLNVTGKEVNTANIRGVDARILIVIDGPEAPTRYEFNATLPEGASLIPTPDGGIEVVDASGEAIAFIESPWAIDANGVAVDTHFKVHGETLFQIVDHHGAMYPVVADPAVRTDCGWITCTTRFDRATTRWIKDHSEVTFGLAILACGKTGPLAFKCAAAMIAIAWAVIANARNYYNNGNCYGIRYLRANSSFGSPAWSHQVQRGTFNCR